MRKKSARKSKPLYREKLPASDPVGHPVSTAPLILNDDGSIQSVPQPSTLNSHLSAVASAKAELVFRSETPFIRLYRGNCLELLDAIAEKYPDGRFDAIFADPPYFLSNGGITCHAGKMVKVDKGEWDKSQGPELNHEFNLEWLRRCQRVLKPNGTIWVSGTHPRPAHPKSKHLRQD